MKATSPTLVRGCRHLLLLLFAIALAQSAFAANYYQGVATNNLPWPGGTVPYVFATNVTPVEQALYLAGMREWELAANVHFVPRTTQSNYVQLQFSYLSGTDTYVASFPVAVMTVDTLARSQICHETGHLLGLQHEHVRTDRDTNITVNFSNLITGTSESGSVASLYQIDSNSTLHGTYDFESVMHYSRTLFSQDPSNLDVMVPKAPFFNQYYYRIGNFALSPGDRAGIAFLYGPPSTPLTNIVTTTADVGAGSLRAAIYYANDHPGTTIHFNIPTNDTGFSNGVYTIHTTGELPPLVANGTVIDATTQPGYVNHPVVVIDGSQLNPELTFPTQFFISGLHIFAANCTVSGLAINNFPFVAINIEFALAISNRIQGCYIGVAPNGTTAAPNAYQGISIDTGASRNFIGGTNVSQRNVISGNTQYGILITGTNGLRGASIIGSNVNNNTILGNYIGLNGAGTAALSNNKSGIAIWGGASSNVIGGTAAGARNIISGNTEYGIYTRDSNTVGTLIQGNYIGSDTTGTLATPNNLGGIGIFSVANNIAIGGTNTGAGNVISGNGVAGIFLGDPGTTNNLIQGNYIGVATNGTSALPNQGAGIYLLSGPQSNLIGGTAAGAGNLISGNAGYGVWFYGANTIQNLVQGNYIGVASNGTSALPNTSLGIYIEFANSNTVGGIVASAGNLISGNNSDGLQIYDGSYNVVQGNLIGTDKTGLHALGNQVSGLSAIGGATFNTIGGTNAAARNILSGNITGDGVYIGYPGTSNNVVQGNYIGTDSTGSNALGNGGSGLVADFGAQNNLIGGTTAGAGNLVSANLGDGIAVTGVGATANTVQGNLVGIKINGTNRLGNGGSAMNVSGGATFNTIGGSTAAARNIFSGSTNYDGVFMSAASNNVIQGNYIGTDITGLKAMTNGSFGYGLALFTASQNNQILGNVIGASVNQCIFIADPGTSGNRIQGNNIGVGANGTAILGNGAQGIEIGNDASGNVIGLSTSGAGVGNIIINNAFEGVIIYTNSIGNTIRGNSIYNNGALGINLVGGTENFSGVTSNHVGGAVAGPNDLQNYPVITAASTSTTQLTVSGTLNSTANRSFLIDVYNIHLADPSGYGEGQTYLGSTSLTTGGTGNGFFAFTTSGNFTGQPFTVTATDTVTGDTSEFSLNAVATNGPVAPTLTGPYLLNSNGFSFKLSLNNNQNFTVQAATNLATNPVVWVTLTNATSTSVLMPFTDRSATNPAIRQRFYRAFSP